MRIVIIYILLLISLLANSQQSALKSRTLIWFGLDYSNANFIGTNEFNNYEILNNLLFAQWNSVIINEKEKYNFIKFYQKDDVKYYLDLITERNKNIDVKPAISDNYVKSMHLSKDTIQNIIDSYKIPDGMNGLGLVYIVESYNKFSNIGFYYVVFFNIASREVVYAERFDGKAKGVGLRNHWANTVIYVLKKSGEKYKKMIKKL
jgi:hypothetical protein